MKTIQTMAKIQVLKDSREQEGWSWPNMEVTALKTGDYTLRGLENIFIIERKASVSEIAKNITEKRFINELERLREFQWAYLLCEFSVSDILAWPKSSGLSLAKQRLIRTTGPFILKRLMEYTMQYGIHVLFAGSKGKELAECLFKRALEFGPSQNMKSESKNGKEEI